MSAIPEPDKRLSRAEVEAALTAFSPADWQRASAIAASLCRGISGWQPADLLQETLVKLLDGTRVWRHDIHPLVVLKTAMHSIASNARRNAKARPVNENVVVDPLQPDDGDETPVAHGIASITPEDQTSGKQQMVALYASLGGDEELELLVMAWADGLRGEEAREELGWDRKKYDAARNRLLRRLAALDPDRRAK